VKGKCEGYLFKEHRIFDCLLSTICKLFNISKYLLKR
jgi:hypothetical protein